MGFTLNRPVKMGLRGVAVGAAALGLVFVGRASALPVSTTDLWQSATVLTHTGVVSQSDIRDMFGGAFAAVEAGNTVFRDFQPAGTLHSVEWQTAAAVTLRSFVLNAAHDGPPRDANARGFSEFRLYAFDTLSASFALVFTFDPANPYGTSSAPANGVVETNASLNLLSLGVNLAPVTAQRFKADFIQFGTFGGTANGPRIMELDGFDTFLTQASVPQAPEPATLAFFGLGLAALGLARRAKRSV
jgi:hypothetical protein